MNVKEALECSVSESTLDVMSSRLEEFASESRAYAGLAQFDSYRLEFEKVLRVVRKSVDSQRRMVRTHGTLSREYSRAVDAAFGLEGAPCVTEEQLQEARRELEEVRNSRKEATERRNLLEQELSKSKETLDRLKRDSQKSVDELAELKAFDKSLNEAALNLYTELGTCADRSSRQRAERDKLVASVTELTESLAEKEGEAEILKVSVECGSRLVERRQFVVEGIHRDQTTKSEEVANLEKNLGVLSEEASRAAGLLSAEEARLEKEQADQKSYAQKVLDLEANIKTLESDLRAAQSACDEVKDKLSSASRLNDDLCGRYKRACADLERVDKGAGQMDTRNLQLLRSIDELRATDVSICGKLSRLVQEVESSCRSAGNQSILDSAEEALVASSSIASRSKTRFNKSLQDFAAHTDQVTSLKSKTKSLSEELVALEEKKSSLSIELESLRKNLSKSESVLSSAKDAYRAKLGWAKQNELQFEEAISEYEAANRDYGELKALSEKKSAEFSEVQSQVESLRADVKTLDLSIEALQSEISEKEASFSDERAKAVKAKADLKQKSDALSQLKFSQQFLIDECTNMDLKIEALKSSIAQVESDIDSTRRHVELTALNRDALAMRVVRKNDDFSLEGVLHSKLLLEFTAKRKELEFNSAELKFSQSAKDELGVKLANIKSASKLVDNDLKSLELRHEVLRQEESLGVALVDLLENPENVSRWRQIECRVRDLESSESATSKLEKLRRTLLDLTKKEIVYKDQVDLAQKSLDALRNNLGSQNEKERKDLDLRFVLSKRKSLLRSLLGERRALTSQLESARSQCKAEYDGISKMNNETYSARQDEYLRKSVEQAQNSGLVDSGRNDGSRGPNRDEPSSVAVAGATTTGV